MIPMESVYSKGVPFRGPPDVNNPKWGNRETKRKFRFWKLVSPILSNVKKSLNSMLKPFFPNPTKMVRDIAENSVQWRIQAEEK